jgi:hypothetical protein
MSNIKCKHCRRLVSADPESLRSHLRTDHPIIMSAIDADMIPKEASALRLAILSGLNINA